MRYLTDTEILNWNQRLTNSNYMLRPKSTSKSSEVNICFLQKVKNGVGFDFIETVDPSIRWRFIFSVSNNRTTDFFKIFDKIKSTHLGNKSVYIGPNGNSEKEENIPITEKSIDKIEKENHSLKGKEFTRFTYIFHARLSQIIAYITTLEDTIKLFEKIWGYDENGKELCLLDFPIGTICSLKKDKSSDYIVLDYDYKIDWTEYNIFYKISKMEWTESSQIVKYGNVELVKESDMCFSRNNRIDDILDQ